MSIFSFFTSLALLISNLWISIKKEWLNIEPQVKSTVEAMITLGNTLKAYIQNPGSAGLVAGDLIQYLENIIGTQYTQLITDIITEIVLDLGIVEVALTDPMAAWQAWLDHAKDLNSTALGKLIFETVCSIVEKLFTDLNNNQIKSLIAFVYDTFFKGTSVSLANITLVQNATA